MSGQLHRLHSLSQTSQAHISELTSDADRLLDSTLRSRIKAAPEDIADMYGSLCTAFDSLHCPYLLDLLSVMMLLLLQRYGACAWC